MLLNLSGAHGPFFTRNIVILTDSAGNTGLGEVPGGEADPPHPRGRRRAAGRGPADRRATAQLLRRVRQPVRRPRRRRPRRADLRPAHHRPRRHRARIRAARPAGPAPRRAGGGAARRRPAARPGADAGLPVLRRRPRRGPICPTWRERDAGGRLGAAPPRGGPDPGSRRRAWPKPRSSATASSDFKLKGGVLAGDAGGRGGDRAGRAVPRRPDHPGPQRRLARSPRPSSSCRGLGDVLAYAEDPCGAGGRLLRPRDHGRVPARDRAAHRHQHDRHRLARRWRTPSARNAVDIPLADPHFWTMHGFGARRAAVRRLRA